MTPDSIKISDVFWIALDKLNINRSTLIKQAELHLAIAHKGARIKIVDLFKLWRALEQLGGPDIGFRLVAAIDSNNMPLSSLVAYYAKNLRDAIYRIVRYKSLCTPEELKIIETHRNS
ncbi:AraC family transcriptional regulator ligand-binding domain-containing protein [Acinetobacter baumannii]|nr:AraC family transcriptional regulator ligand-binding domain-containing protein [Acinetobacter baumannii]ELW93955.1 transcription regulator AraC N-terminal arabinose-binding domain protein [Acinetobacter baumannii AA-014]MBD0073706.1 AraC family transcriptional regulator ligand-binding domain-containing protein [Acinetobacter baumannii]MBD0087865.1 AraC family transcriptional regulator ligand-binding domain-containing protein [Acinetobacter baumannii]MBD0092651.1 AraC family transcriptional r